MPSINTLPSKREIAYSRLREATTLLEEESTDIEFIISLVKSGLGELVEINNEE